MHTRYLLLATAERDAPLSDQRVVGVGQAHDEIVGIGCVQLNNLDNNSTLF
jgi:hypothetical protein